MHSVLQSKRKKITWLYTVEDNHLVPAVPGNFSNTVVKWNIFAGNQEGNGLNNFIEKKNFSKSNSL